MPPTVEPRTIDLAPLCTRALIAPSTVDNDARTVELIVSTGAPVVRMDWWTGKRYVEKLSMDPAHIRLDRLNAGAPLLDSHSGESVRDQLGVVVPNTASIKGKKVRAVVQFSRRDDVSDIWQDVREGIIRNVSVGYRVHKFEEQAGKDDIPIRTAIDWEPYEVSMVPMPADMEAQVRGARPTLNHCDIVVRAADTTEPSVTQEQPMQDQERSETMVEDNPAVPSQEALRMTPAPPAEPDDLQRGADAERERIEGIISACTAARMPVSLQMRLIADKVPLVRAQALIFDEMRKRGGDTLAPGHGPRREVVVGTDPLVHVRAGIENALQHRIAPQYFKLEDVGREYRGMTLIDVAKVYLQQVGVRTSGMSRLEVAGMALGLNHRTGMHTTSDFALLLADAASKTLRRAYDEAPQTFQAISRRVTLPDFKASNRLQIGDAPDLAEVPEHAEFTRGTILEGREQMQLATYGRIFAITRQALVNDDTDAFSRVPTLFGRAARKLESDLVWQQITSNPTMADGNALFSTAHGNLESDGEPISIDSLTIARRRIRLQKGIDGTTPLNLVPRYLIVPPSLETFAEQIVAPLMGATTVGTQNIFAGKLTVIVEPRLEANSTLAWYVAASPDQVDILEYAYLEGQEGPMIENRVGFDIDGLEIKARLDFAAKAVDWRGINKNPGETHT